MLGFAVSALCFAGLMGMMAGSRRRHCHAAHHRRWRGRRSRRGFERAAAEVFKRRLDIDEEQEDVVDHALKDVRSTLRELKAELGGHREELAELFGPALSERTGVEAPTWELVLALAYARATGKERDGDAL